MHLFVVNCICCIYLFYIVKSLLCIFGFTIFYWIIYINFTLYLCKYIKYTYVYCSIFTVYFHSFLVMVNFVSFINKMFPLQNTLFLFSSMVFMVSVLKCKNFFNEILIKIKFHWSIILKISENSMRCIPWNIVKS